MTTEKFDGIRPYSPLTKEEFYPAEFEKYNFNYDFFGLGDGSTTWKLGPDVDKEFVLKQTITLGN